VSNESKNEIRKAFGIRDTDSGWAEVWDEYTPDMRKKAEWVLANSPKNYADKSDVVVSAMMDFIEDHRNDNLPSEAELKSLQYVLNGFVLRNAGRKKYEATQTQDREKMIAENKQREIESLQNKILRRYNGIDLDELQNRLKPAHFRTIELTSERHSHQEIAELEGCSVSSVRRHIERVVKTAMQMLAEGGREL